MHINTVAGRSSFRYLNRRLTVATLLLASLSSGSRA